MSKFIITENQLNKILLNEVKYTEFFIRRIADKAGIDISNYDIDEVTDGFRVELEHGTKGGRYNVTNDDPIKTLKITLAHLDERRDYYHRLKKYVEM